MPHSREVVWRNSFEDIHLRRKSRRALPAPPPGPVIPARDPSLISSHGRVCFARRSAALQLIRSCTGRRLGAARCTYQHVPEVRARLLHLGAQAAHCWVLSPTLYIRPLTHASKHPLIWW